MLVVDVTFLNASNFKVAFEWEFTNGVPSILGINGANGVGKSRFLRLIAGVYSDVSIFSSVLGRISYCDRVFFDSLAKINLPVRERSVVGIGRESRLVSGLSVRKNIELAMRSIGHSGVGNSLNLSFDELCHSLFISDTLLKKRVDAISSGEYQKVLLCRSIINNPKLLIFDECFDMIDEASRKSILQFVKNKVSVHIPVILVHHNSNDFNEVVTSSISF